MVKRKEAAKQNILVALQERPRIITAAETKIKEAETQAKISVETVIKISSLQYLSVLRNILNRP